MLTKSEIQKMSFKERLESLELLWDSISSSPEKIKSPEWHGKVLSERKKKIEQGDTTFTSISEARKQLR